MDCLTSCIPNLFTTTTTRIQNNSTDKQATEIVNILLKAEKPGQQLQFDIESVIKIESWTSKLAEAVLHKLEEAIKLGARVGTAMAYALEQAEHLIHEEASALAQFAKDHPLVVALLAVAVLAALAPWALEALGFAELGPVEGLYSKLIE